MDLIDSRGDKGKWFAAAKDAGFLDLALECAAHHGADPSTLARAARDYNTKEPAFAATIALLAISHLLTGGGYDPAVSEITDAVGYLMSASSKIGAADWARKELGKLAEDPCSPGREPFRHALKTALLRHEAENADI